MGLFLRLKQLLIKNSFSILAFDNDNTFIMADPCRNKDNREIFPSFWIYSMSDLDAKTHDCSKSLAKDVKDVEELVHIDDVIEVAIVEGAQAAVDFVSYDVEIVEMLHDKDYVVDASVLESSHLAMLNFAFDGTSLE